MLLQMALFCSFFMAGWYSIVCVCVYIYIYIHIYIPHLLYPFIRHLGLPILAIVNSAAMNLGGMYIFEL